MRSTLLLIPLICFLNLVNGQNKNNSTYKLLIGTYTTSTNNDGIWVYDFDTQTGNFTYKSKVSGVESPSYLAINRDGKHVYSVNEVRNGGVS